MIYLDHNSNTPIDKDVAEEMIYLLQNSFVGNPSSNHSCGRKLKSVLETARGKVKESLHIPANSRDYTVVFTASCTEGNNISILGCKTHSPITIPIEHHSVLRCISDSHLKINECGEVDLAYLDQILADRQKNNIKSLVSIALANSSLGVLQDIKAISEIAHQYDALVHTDAAQAFGKIDIDLPSLGVDIITLSSHKMGGPSGAAAIVFRTDIPLEPIMMGGKQESRLRPGSQNTLAIHCFGLACDKVHDRVRLMNSDSSHSIISLRRNMEKRIQDYASDARVFSQNANRLPNTSSIFMPNVKGEIQVAHFDTNKICVSAGYSCASGVSENPYVHMGIGLKKEDAFCTLRVSMGLNTSQDDVDAFVLQWQKLYDRCNKK